MNYRRLGQSGLKVSELSLGSWVSFNNQLDVTAAQDCMTAAYDAGCNFFDNAEAYAGGKSEEIMGAVFKNTGWPRVTYVVSTKFYWGLKRGPNDNNTLNAKYLRQAIDNSLKRLQLDYVDLVFCHRQDLDTPVEETVRAMNDMITTGKALYWGTSEWSAERILEAVAVCDRLGLRRPVMEQPQYNLLSRDRLEREYAPVFKLTGMGTTVWSPLAGGLLSGKYTSGVPDGSRATVANAAMVKDGLLNAERNAKVKRLMPIAADLGCTLSQLALAWVLKNPNVSSAITGASRPAQIAENFKAGEIVTKLTDDVMQAIDDATV